MAGGLYISNALPAVSGGYPMNSNSRATAVGNATTSAVVISSVLILAADYVLTSIFL